MLTEIGSNFWNYSLQRMDEQKIFFWQSEVYNKQYFKSGRNAIKALCKNLNIYKKTVVLPIYTCETCIQPFIDEGWEISYYYLNEDLTINEERFIETYSTKKPSVIFLHSFFGFDTIKNEEFLCKIKEDGTIIVEDMTQSLFSNHYLRCADYYVTSLRKFLAIPEGGVLISPNMFRDYSICNADVNIEKIALNAFDLKKEYFVNPSIEKKEIFRQKYNELNLLIAQNDKLQQMGSISRKIIFTCNSENIIKTRRKNYELLSDAIENIQYVKKVIDDDMDGVCPLYFPIYVENREKLQTYLSKNNVYCPIIWKKATQIDTQDEVTEYMYSHMLCIPIDQRYGQLEMNRIVDLLSDYYLTGEKNG